jgi:N-acetylmuramoyl-L-alanine amidase
LAKYLQEAMGRVSSLMPSRGLRQAPFKVLKGAKMPAALVEMGYLTHPAQSRLLASRNTQKEAAKALSKGILTYLSATGRR